GAFLLTPGLVTDAVGFLLALPLSRVPIRVALKKYVVVPYIERETDGFFSGNVYIGGFPDDGEGDFTMGGGGFSGGGPGGASGSGPDGFDGGNGADPDGSAGGNADAGGASADDDVVDVDFTVEEEERKGTD
ncbi:FxsA, partial [Halorubrum sp. E3]